MKRTSKSLLPSVADLVTEVNHLVTEYDRAKSKHGDMTLDGPEVTDRLRLAALMEEAGEVAAELTYDKAGDPERLYGELIQVANVAVTWARHLRIERKTT